LVVHSDRLPGVPEPGSTPDGPLSPAQDYLVRDCGSDLAAGDCDHRDYFTSARMHAPDIEGVIAYMQ
jgi:hypothetical protein